MWLPLSRLRERGQGRGRSGRKLLGAGEALNRGQLEGEPRLGADLGADSFDGMEESGDAGMDLEVDLGAEVGEGLGEAIERLAPTGEPVGVATEGPPMGADGVVDRTLEITAESSCGIVAEHAEGGDEPGQDGRADVVDVGRLEPGLAAAGVYEGPITIEKEDPRLVCARECEQPEQSRARGGGFV